MNVKATGLCLAFALGLSTVFSASAQVPAGSTGQCKDNSYTTAESKRGACRGHGGVKEWYAADKAEPKAEPSRSKDSKAAAKGSMSETQAPKPAAKTTANRTEPAAGGGAGKVWLNAASNVYHCEGTRWYGKTKKGEYMTEAEAKAKNAHADHGKACS